MVKRISITGPESTGKSRLAKELSGIFNTPWVPEYARTYLEGIDREYTYHDILEISKGQYDLEREMMPRANRYLFCDTDFLVARIWCEFKYGKCHSWIMDMAEKDTYDFYLLCDTDLPWEPDPLRENPGQRSELMQLYVDALKQMNANYFIVNGKGIERTYNAAKQLIKLS